MSLAYLAGDDNWLSRFGKIGYVAAGKDLEMKHGVYYIKDGGPNEEGAIAKRQNAGCNTYGLDFQDGGSVPTVPDNAPELATCPVLKDQIASGDFLIIAVGNNGNGTPFAYQREFNISAGPQQATTYYYTPTVTSTPIVITTCKLLPNRIYT